MLKPLIFICTLCINIDVIKCNEMKEIKMPGVTPMESDKYLCTSLNVNTTDPRYIVGFTPHASMQSVHHILLYSCITPGSTDPVWDCGSMSGGMHSHHSSHNQHQQHHHGHHHHHQHHNHGPSTKPQYTKGPVCASGQQFVYAWALDAPELKLPEGVGFQTGGDSKIKHLVMQLHYMHPMNKPDKTGITINFTNAEMPRKAAILVLGSDGMMKAKSSENFETACLVKEDVTLHPFAFRTHTHGRGKVVSGYVIDGKTSQWQLIGKKDPSLPQMFYPVENKGIVIKTDDILAARCTMVNKDDRAVEVGATGAHEMCNFYIMYWVDKGSRALNTTKCFSAGPPKYYWKTDPILKNMNIPDKEASLL